MAWGRSAFCILLNAQDDFCHGAQHVACQNRAPASFPASAGEHACKFTFQDLCGRNIGAADFIALANQYHTMALQGVPIFTGATKSEAYRHVHLHAPARAIEPATMGELQQPLQTAWQQPCCWTAWISTCLLLALAVPRALQLGCTLARLLFPHQLVMPLLHMT